MSGRTSAFFNEYAPDFAAIYGTEGGLLRTAINRVLRRSMYLRFLETLAECQPLDGCTVLDVGCGPGHYAVEIALRGASRVTGIDIAPRMIELAKERAAQMMVVDRCRFTVQDFESVDEYVGFDYVILMGFMDYQELPAHVIERALRLTRRKALFSFPVSRGLLAWQRRVRYRRKCYLRMYSRDEIERLFASSGCSDVTIKKIARDYFVIARPTGGGR